MSALPPEVRELLELIRTALDLPYAVDGEGDRRRERLLRDNTVRTVLHLEHILDDDRPDVAFEAQILRKTLAEHPVNYTVRLEQEPGR